MKFLLLFPNEQAGRRLGEALSKLLNVSFADYIYDFMKYSFGDDFVYYKNGSVKGLRKIIEAELEMGDNFLLLNGSILELLKKLYVKKKLSVHETRIFKAHIKKFDVIIYCFTSADYYYHIFFKLDMFYGGALMKLQKNYKFNLIVNNSYSLGAKKRAEEIFKEIAEKYKNFNFRG